MYRSAQINSPPRGYAAARTRVLATAEKKGLAEMYAKMGVDGVRRHLQTSGWHNALGDPAVRAFAYEWLAEAEKRHDRSGILRKFVVFAALVLFAGVAGFFMSSNSGLSEFFTAYVM